VPKLFSYVVDHDCGFAPCPHQGHCTLAKCKFGTSHKNVVELAEAGDWVVGTGGADLKKSAGHGKVVYAMRVDEKLPFDQYCKDRRFWNRPDADPEPPESHGDFALVSRHFFYFGRDAIDVSDLPASHLSHPFEKRGPGHRSDFGADFIRDLASWLERTFEIGVHGPPCKVLPDLPAPGVTAVRKKRSGNVRWCVAKSKRTWGEPP
jgi:hypothetical protein